MSVMCVSEKIEVNCLKNLMVLFFLRNFCEIKLISPKLAVFCAPKIATISGRPSEFFKTGSIRPAAKKELHSP